MQPTRELLGGTRMPVLGLGVWRMAAGRETEQAVEWALEAGYRHIDTASMYRNEQSVGAALRRSGVPRDQVFVTTKLFPARLRAGRELEHSLRRLGLDYVDLYLIHWPLPLLNARLWRALEALQERGLAREIGVSNFGSERLAGLTRGAARIPAVNQVEFNPFRYRRRLLEHCQAHGIALEAYSPLARGHGPDDPTIAAVADRIGHTPAQVMLRWALQHGALVIPKSVQRDRIRANAQLFDFHLAEADMRILDALDRTRGTQHARG
ncbi:MAG TPA: aldo/keto reductase [Gaiellales bacterium]|nr:aldo/keto reductase [Gaiellales bacterium]